MSSHKHISFMGFCELVEWRDSVKDKQKAERIQRVINRKLEYLKRIQYPYWPIFNKVNVDGVKWRNR